MPRLPMTDEIFDDVAGPLPTHDRRHILDSEEWRFEIQRENLVDD